MTQQQVPEFVSVAQIGDVRSGEGKLVRPMAGQLRGKPIALFNDNGTFYAVNFVCPHAGGPMSEGTIARGIVTCPYHAWSWHAETGHPSAALDGHPLTVYQVRLEGDQVLIGKAHHSASPQAE